LRLILGSIDGHRERDHGVDPVRGVPTAGMGDPRTATSLLRHRSAYVAVEDRVAGMLMSRADKARQAANGRDREAAEREGRKPDLIERLTLHECRHTFASLLVASGENPKAVQESWGIRRSR
jgi:integrase